MNAADRLRDLAGKLPEDTLAIILVSCYVSGTLTSQEVLDLSSELGIAYALDDYWAVPTIPETVEDQKQAYQNAESINAHRLNKNNPLEKKFAAAWKDINWDNKILSYLLDRTHENRGDHVVTDLEAEVAATMIQWLGTPVGQYFLESVQPLQVARV
jgi:hypothetical protein